VYGDGYNPPAGDDPHDPTRGPEYAQQLLDIIQQLNLNPARIAPMQGREVPFDNLRIAVAAAHGDLNAVVGRFTPPSFNRRVNEPIRGPGLPLAGIQQQFDGRLH
jgi:hypothetical protein